MSCRVSVKTLVNFSGALAGLMMMLVGTFIPTGILLPVAKYPLEIIELPITWQVPSLLLCALLCGPRAGVIAAIAYLTIGLFYLPIFQHGGYTDYLHEPSFGYLLGFIPSAWATGRLAKQKGMNDLVLLSFSAFTGLILLHIFGVINIIIGYSLNRWDDPFWTMVLNYSLVPLLSQLALCPAVGILALSLRGVIFAND